MPPVDRLTLRTRDGVRLSARHWPGTGGPVGYVVAHGFTGSAGAPALDRICRQLAATGAAVLAPDLRGHGRSGGVSTVGDREIWDLAAAVARLRGGGGVAAVAALGWSMGGSVALRYAGLGGDADAVVRVSSPGAWFERGTRPMRVVHWLCETRSGRLVCRVARGTRVAPGGWSPVPESPQQVVSRIAPTPLLLVHGDADHYFPIRHARLLAAAAPQASLWIEPGMGHAEAASTPALLTRIDAWVRDAIGRGGLRR